MATISTQNLPLASGTAAGSGTTPATGKRGRHDGRRLRFTRTVTASYIAIRALGEDIFFSASD